ncbi:NACHT domain-containing protein [Mesorhizobium humile]|uniref:NACHT domain-containing protein n=1 Tax=Mesorhizobium humile TaxID=3072313 RepID=A0ABU4Y9H2_9HYPH|nr:MULTISPECIES: NACHT domain-containing protein [unclassified Mesorhizobium]MDX8458174.1 NACHT domain-containing protein [Mesorhizobium sp. VK2D]MDX8483587.1 NACHT domain-containing protein [Mesorhizobium sp. VK2B]
MTISAIASAAGLDAITKKISNYIVSRLSRRYLIRRSAEFRISTESSLQSDLMQAFGSAGLLNETTYRVLSTVSSSRLLDHLLDAAVTKIDPKFARRLIDRLEMELSGDGAISNPSLSERLWSVSSSLADSESLNLRPRLRSIEQSSRTEERVRRTEVSIAQSLSDKGQGGGTQHLPFIEADDQRLIAESLVNETENFCSQIDVHGASGEVLRVDLDEMFVSTPVEHLGTYQDAVRYGSQRHYHFYPLRPATQWHILLEQIERSVILGDPGGGKSTLSKKLCLEVARAFRGGDAQIPFFLQLRSYVAVWDQDKAVTFLGYIAEQVSQSTPGIPIERISAIVHYLLGTGRLFLVFDGLDEVLSLGNREDIVKKVRNFCDRYPLSRFLLTSRIVGYETTPVRNFDHHVVRGLTHEGMEQLFHNVNKHIVSKGQANTLTQFPAFIQDARNKALELIPNPLLLTLIIIIHSKKREIPDNRFDLYSSCADLLFDRWDSFRNINPTLPERYRLYDLLMHLASVIFEDETLGGRLSKGALEAEAKRFFRNDYVDNKEGRASEAASKLVEHLTGRAWILHEVGEGIFEFTHRTFLEFFYARWLEAKYEKTEELVRHILPHTEGGQRILSSHLALQARVRNKRNAATTAGQLLASEVEKNGRGRHGVISFAAASLEYLLPEAATLTKLSKAISEEALESAIYEPLASLLRTKSPLRPVILAPTIQKLSAVSRLENIRAMQKVYESLYGHTNDPDISSFIDEYLIPSLRSKQGSSPYIVKLIVDLDREPDWNLAQKFGLRLWRPNRRGDSDFDMRATDSGKIIDLVLGQPAAAFSAKQNPLMYLFQLVWERCSTQAGTVNLEISGRSAIYFHKSYQYDDSSMDAISEDNFGAFVFANMMLYEYYERVDDDLTAAIDLQTIQRSALNRTRFLGMTVFKEWIEGNVNLSSRVAPRRNRIEQQVEIRKFAEANAPMEVDDDDDLFGYEMPS